MGKKKRKKSKKARRKFGKIIAYVILIIAFMLFGNEEFNLTDLSDSHIQVDKLVSTDSVKSLISKIKEISIKDIGIKDIAIENLSIKGFSIKGFGIKSLGIKDFGRNSLDVKNNGLMKFATKNPVDLNNIPEFTGEPYVVINDNKPYFKDIDSSGTTLSWESYSDLDNLGRVGVANALIGRDLMPTSKRESIGQVKPSGWQLIRYDDLVNGNYLYNRSHLIAFELAGENANNKNLMTGTRYFNVTGMLPFENSVAQYVKKTNNHVRYRVTPIFVGDELVARGVEMEAYSIEDSGRGVSFNVYVYNNQPGIEINYSDGTSRRK